MRSLYASSLASGPRDAARNVTSRWLRWALADAASQLYEEEFDEGQADDLRTELAAIERAEASGPSGCTTVLELGTAGKDVPAMLQQGRVFERRNRATLWASNHAHPGVFVCSRGCARRAPAMGSAGLNHIAARGSPRRRIVDLDRVAGAERGDGRGRRNNVRGSMHRPCPSAPVSLARPLC